MEDELLLGRRITPQKVMITNLLVYNLFWGYGGSRGKLQPIVSFSVRKPEELGIWPRRGLMWSNCLLPNILSEHVLLFYILSRAFIFLWSFPFHHKNIKINRYRVSLLHYYAALESWATELSASHFYLNRSIHGTSHFSFIVSFNAEAGSIPIIYIYIYFTGSIKNEHLERIMLYVIGYNKKIKINAHRPGEPDDPGTRGRWMHPSLDQGWASLQYGSATQPFYTLLSDALSSCVLICMLVA